MNYNTLVAQMMQAAGKNSLVQPVGGPDRPLSLDAKNQIMLLAEQHGIPFPQLVGIVAQLRKEMGK